MSKKCCYLYDEKKIINSNNKNRKTKVNFMVQLMTNFDIETTIYATDIEEEIDNLINFFDWNLNAFLIANMTDDLYIGLDI